MSQPIQIAPLGGLATTRPPISLDPSQSPDLLNVVLKDGMVQRRGGFQPKFRDRMHRNCIKNEAFRAVGRDKFLAASTADVEYVTAAGCMVAGHRKIYEQQTGLTFALWFSPGELVAEHGGNANAGAVATVWNGAPYTVQVSPILSKGPIKRSDDIVSAAATDWGAHSNAGMPFCLYLFNNAGTWEYRLSAHVLVGGSWTLQTVTSTVTVEEGALYHIIGVCSGTRVALRIAKHYDDTPNSTSSISYTQNATAYTGTLAYNKCPIQVFDCPQRFIEDTSVGSATQRPGLDLGGSSDGGYWFACVRPDGKIQDISIWAGDLTLSDLERRDEIEFDSQEGLINLWSMGSYGRDVVKEETGRGNHLYLCPRGPIETDHGGRDGGSWWFNGQTSYARIDCDTPNWRARERGIRAGAMYDLVVNNRPHGMVVDVWPDSIEPGAEQVIAEIHGVMKLVIDADGKFAAYVRDGVASCATSIPAYSMTEIGALYQGPLTGTTVVECGERYNVAVMFQMKDSSAAYLRLYVDGILEAEDGTYNPSTFASSASSGTGNAPGGVTIGFGSLQPTIRGDYLIDDDMASPNELNTDSTSGFIGHVETFMIVASPKAALDEIRRSNAPEGVKDWAYQESGSYKNPMGVSTVSITTSDYSDEASSPMDPVQYVGDGVLVRLASQREDGYPVVVTATPNAVNPGIYSMYGAHGPAETDPDTPGLFGHDQIDAVGGTSFHTLCYYRFKSDDGRIGAAGSYVASEWVYDDVGGGGPRVTDQQRSPVKRVHLQTTSIFDQLGHLGVVTRCCVESDIISEDNASVFSATADYRREITHRFRPYETRSPYELGVLWSAGMVPSPADANPVTALLDYEVQTDGRSIKIAGAGRQLYWAHPAWSEDGVLEWLGGAESYCYCRTSNVASSIVGTATKTQVVFSAWVRPTRLDDIRLIARKWDVVDDPSLANWLIAASDGAIIVMGSEGGTNVWMFHEGQTSGATPGQLSVSSSLAIGKWSHLQVEIGGATPTVTVRVDGRVVPMLDMNTLTGALQHDAFGAKASDATDGDVFIGGMPRGRSKVTFPNSTGSPVELEFLSWHGSIAEVKIWSSIDTSRWPTGEDGYVPAMGAEDPTALYEWMMRDGSGSLITNTGTTAAATENGDVRIKEFYEIASGIEQEEDRTFRAVAFRDSLIMTNGAHDPLVVTWNGISADDPLTVARLGTEAPIAPEAYVKLVTTTPGTTIVAGIYIVEMTYVTSDGGESEPTTLVSHELTGGPFDTVTILIGNVPRSPDSHVVGCNIYVSATGGGEAVFQRFWPGHSPEIEASVIPGATGLTTLPGTRLPAPKGRHVGIAGSALVLADLPEEESGQNAIAFSTPSDVSYFTLSSTALIDSEDGKAIIGIDHNMGQVFLSKRDSVHVLAVGAIVSALSAQAQMRLVYSSDGIGGGIQNVGNLLYGAGDRGVFVFNNSEPQLLTGEIDRTWRDEVLATDLGLYLMRGAFWRKHGQYWLSVRLESDDGSQTTILAVDTKTGTWTRHLVPAHSVMAILEDTVSQDPEVAIGTTDGRILVYNDEVDIDGASDEAVAIGDVTLSETGILTGSATSLVDSGAVFPTALAGLAGAWVTIVTNAGTFSRKIARNWVNEIQWSEPIPGWTSHTSYTIGGFEAYWTSPWLSGNIRTRDQKLVGVQAEFEPRVGTLDVACATCAATMTPERDWPASGSYEELPAIDMSAGYTERPRTPRSMATGAYHRVKFGTSGIRKPWALMTYGVEIAPGAAHAKTGRTS